MHRPTCRTCPFWEGPEPSPYEGDEETYGDCRRFPPRVTPTRAMLAWRGTDFECDPTPKVRFELHAGAFPMVCESEWCGEHPDFPAYARSLNRSDARPALPTLEELFPADGTGRAARTLNALDSAGCYSTADLLRLTPWRLHDVRSVGPTTFLYVIRRLEKFGLTLANSSSGSGGGAEG